MNDKSESRQVGLEFRVPEPLEDHGPRATLEIQELGEALDAPH